jgi:Mrp family chromosome partitioning ATPase/predicted Fe-Mo cluster-binding NifX family protein
MLKNSPERDKELEHLLMQDRLSKIKNKIVVLSGKGGVGKSTVATNIAMSLALKGCKTGLLDIDLHGPSIPTMLGLQNKKLQSTETGLKPCGYGENFKVISISFLLNNRDDAVIWRGPAKMGMIKQFIMNVEWGELDYLIVDCPPGTGDEPLSIVQLLEEVTGAVIVTTPQQVSVLDVRKSIDFCRKLEVPVLGVIENMSGFICPECNKTVDIFKSGGGEAMAKEMNVPFLGKIPLDPAIVDAGDSGKPFVYFYAETQTASIIEDIIKPLSEVTDTNQTKEEKKLMRFAIPTNSGRLCLHFGHCEVFTLIDVDPESKTITSQQTIEPPPHQPGLLPPWLAEQGANVIIAGGMGGRAIALFEEQNIKVIVGAEEGDPETLVKAYLEGTLKAGANVCDH